MATDAMHSHEYHSMSNTLDIRAPILRLWCYIGHLLTYLLTYSLSASKQIAYCTKTPSDLYCSIQEIRRAQL